MTTTVKARDLRDALRAAIPFTADVEDCLPDLSAIYIEAAGGTLTATATNRYVLGHARTTAHVDTGIPGVLIADHDAQWIADGLKRNDRDTTVELAVTDGLLRITTPGYRSRVAEVTAEVKPWVKYPDLFGDFFTPRETGLTAPILIRPQLLTAVAALADIYPAQPTRWTFVAADRPARFEISGKFVGLVMPTGVVGDDSHNWPVPVGVPQAVAA